MVLKHESSPLDRVHAEKDGGNGPIHGNGCRSRVKRVREHERASFSHIRSGDLREGARRSEGEWEHPVKVAQFGKKIILQAAKMDFSDDGGVEKKTKQEGKQRKRGYMTLVFVL